MSERVAGQAPELAVAGRMATVTLRRPGVANRLELSDLDAFHGAIARVNALPEVMVLRVRAQGRHFCSGFNIGQMDGEGGGAEAGARFEALAAALEQARPVTIAELHGGVYGGATDLALACDFRIGSTQTEMQVPAARLGLLYYRGGMERFVSRLGVQTAKRLLLMADKLTAEQMLACGYLDRLHASNDELRADVDALSEQLAGMAPLALLGMKQHLNRIAAGTVDADALDRDIATCGASQDLREGALAWQQKRAPQFIGR
jgi:enoyl-CoA hydratase/carnithine racemase